MSQVETDRRSPVAYHHHDPGALCGERRKRKIRSAETAEKAKSYCTDRALDYPRQKRRSGLGVESAFSRLLFALLVKWLAKPWAIAVVE